MCDQETCFDVELACCLCPPPPPRCLTRKKVCCQRPCCPPPCPPPQICYPCLPPPMCPCPSPCPPPPCPSEEPCAMPEEMYTVILPKDACGSKVTYNIDTCGQVCRQVDGNGVFMQTPCCNGVLLEACGGCNPCGQCCFVNVRSICNPPESCPQYCCPGDPCCNQPTPAMPCNSPYPPIRCPMPCPPSGPRCRVLTDIKPMCCQPKMC